VADPALTIGAQKYAPQKLSDRAARDQALSHKLDGKEPFPARRNTGVYHPH